MQVTDQIIRNISRYTVLEEQEKVDFLSLLSFREIAKKEAILTAGQACQHLNYVHSGTLRAFCFDEEGKESTVMFAVADWWITDMFCFLNQKPAMLYIEALEGSSVFQLSRANFEHLFATQPSFERVFRILMQNAYTREQLRVIERLTLSAEERYDNFITKYPQFVEKVPQKHIASYLGITPEFLSAIRRGKLGR
jgi:CRP-like cAMP-binding protein